MLIRSVAALSLATLLLSSAAFAADRQEIETIVEEYIRTHPEVLMQTLQKYQEEARARQEQAEFMAAVKNPVAVPEENSPALGPKNAPITIVEFSDFECPYCARSWPTIQGIMKRHEGKVRVIYKHSPLPFHKKAIPAHKAALAAARQGKFWPYHDLLVANLQTWQGGDEQAAFAAYADQLGLDAARFRKDMADPKLDETIQRDMKLGEKLGVQGTPTYFVNGVIVRGARSGDYFQKVIDATAK